MLIAAFHSTSRLVLDSIADYGQDAGAEHLWLRIFSKIGEGLYLAYTVATLAIDFIPEEMLESRICAQEKTLIIITDASEFESQIHVVTLRTTRTNF